MFKAKTSKAEALDSMQSIVYLLGGLLVLCSSIAAADEWSFDGHIKYHIAATHYESDNIIAQYGEQSPLDNSIDFRLMTENNWGAWDTKIHYEVLALYGDTPETQQALAATGLDAASFGLPKDDRRLFNLTGEWGDDDKLDAVHRLDRLYLGYNGEELVIRVGRQTVSWGNGLIFHPLDIFSPFSPTDIDKDYKTGDDMLYGQWLFENGNDVQMILLPRRNPETDEVESEQSSLALKYRGSYQDKWDYDLLAARHFDENVFGLGLSRDVWEAIWRFDISATRLKEGGTAVSLVTNMDYSWEWFEHNFYGYIEYFRNGVGETEPANYLSPDTALQKRVQRGEVYTRSRDYIGSGVRIELTPLFNLYSSWIGNLHDNSGIFQIRGIYDWAENLQLVGWLDLPYGDKDTEFGGLEIGESSQYLAPGHRIYLRLSYYF